MWYLAILITIRFDSFGVEPIPAKFFGVQEKFDVIANMFRLEAHCLKVC